MALLEGIDRRRRRFHYHMNETSELHFLLEGSGAIKAALIAATVVRFVRKESNMSVLNSLAGIGTWVISDRDRCAKQAMTTTSTKHDIRERMPYDEYPLVRS